MEENKNEGIHEENKIEAIHEENKIEAMQDGTQEDIMNAEEYPMEEIQEGPIKHARKGWGRAMVYAVGLILLALAIQMISGIGAGVFLTIKMTIQYGGDTEQVLANYQNEILESGFLNIVVAITTVITTTLFGLWYKFKYAKKSQMEQFNSKMKKAFAPDQIGFLLLLAVTCYILAMNVIIIIGYLSEGTLDTYRQMTQLAFSEGPITFILAVFLAPIGEECLVRGLIQRRLEKYLPMTAVLIIVAVLFGILHANIVQGIFVIPLGLATGYLSYKFQSVLPAILLHMVYNFIPQVIDLVPGTILDQDIVWQIAAVVLVICTVVVKKAMSGREKLNVDEN